MTVKNGDARRAAAIANRWAARFVEAANDLYAPNKDELAFYETQQAEAEADLARAEQDLVDFQARNQAAVLTSLLDDKQAALEETLTVARSMRFVIQDAQVLRDRLRAQDAGAIASTSDELTSLLLQWAKS